mgnify:CR=1 FL=1
MKPGKTLLIGAVLAALSAGAARADDVPANDLQIGRAHV